MCDAQGQLLNLAIGIRPGTKVRLLGIPAYPNRMVWFMAVLTDEQVDAALPDLDGWERTDGALRRSVKFPSFLAGIDAVRRVGEHAESEDHHPNIDIRWRTVTFALVTHSEGGITDKDVAMARDIDGIISD
jgi:4a-hydroxytetrahydrobiopterin dehydratase